LKIFFVTKIRSILSSYFILNLKISIEQYYAYIVSTIERERERERVVDWCEGRVFPHENSSIWKEYCG